MATFQAGKNWKDVDQKFLETLKAYAEKFEANSGYDVSFYSGYRPGSGQSEHGHGEAVDIRLTDRNTGQALPNYQVHGNPEVTRAYQSFANGLKGYADQNAPEIGQNLRWGGYFSGVGNPSKYGAMDLMHFDLGGRRGMGMLGGDFQHGFTPAQARTYGIQPGGGMGDTASLMKQQGAQGSAQPVAGAQPIPNPQARRRLRGTCRTPAPWARGWVLPCVLWIRVGWGSTGRRRRASWAICSRRASPTYA